MDEQKEGNVKEKETVTILKDEETNQSLREQLFKEFIEWGMTGSIIGFVQLFRTDFWLNRIMWIVAILGASAGGFYFLAQSAIVYAQFGVLNQISINKQYPTLYPAVTVCNINPFYSNRSKAYLDNLLTINNLTDFIAVTNADTLGIKFGSNNTIQLLEDVAGKLKAWIVSDNLTVTSRRNLGYELKDELMRSCSFNGKICSDTDFKYSRLYRYGNCFTFNSGFNSAGQKVDILQTSKTGSNSGLQLELLVGNPNETARFVYKSGIYLIVHNQTFTPVEVQDGGIFISTGFDTFVGIQRQFYNKLPSPYSTCLDDFSTPPNDYAKKIYGYMSDSGATVYSQDYCTNMCYQDQLVDKCKCADAEFPTVRGASYCSTTSQLSCLETFEQTFSSSNTDTQCQSACPFKCTTVRYQLSTTGAYYPSSYYVNLLKSKTDFSEDFDVSSSFKKLRQNLLKISVSYKDLKYELKQEVAVMDVVSLFGNIGGTIGFFTGLSFLTFFEIPHLLIDFFRLWYLDRKNKKNKQD